MIRPVAAGVRVALYTGERRVAQLCVLLGFDVLSTWDLSAGGHADYAFTRPLEMPTGQLRLRLGDDRRRPQLKYQQLGRVGLLRLGKLPSAVAPAYQPQEACRWAAAGAELAIELPAWFYGDRPPPFDAGPPEWASAISRREEAVPPEIAAEIRRRVDAGESQTAVGRAFGLTRGQVGHQIRKAGYIPAASSGRTKPRSAIEPRTRPCMCCGTAFQSEGPHHRLCDHCRRDSGLPAQFDAAGGVRWCRAARPVT